MVKNSTLRKSVVRHSSLTPLFAHLLELPNRIGLSREEYLTVQQIYRGWALTGVFVFGALLSTAT